MLVLSRKIGERITIGDNITVVIQRIAGGRVSLGVEAPREVSILRSELDRHEPSAQAERETPPLPMGGAATASAPPAVLPPPSSMAAAIAARRSAFA